MDYADFNKNDFVLCTTRTKIAELLQNEALTLDQMVEKSKLSFPQIYRNVTEMVKKEELIFKKVGRTKFYGLATIAKETISRLGLPMDPQLERAQKVPIKKEEQTIIQIKPMNNYEDSLDMKEEPQNGQEEILQPGNGN